MAPCGVTLPQPDPATLWPPTRAGCCPEITGQRPRARERRQRTDVSRRRRPRTASGGQQRTGPPAPPRTGRWGQPRLLQGGGVAPRLASCPCAGLLGVTCLLRGPGGCWLLRAGWASAAVQGSPPAGASSRHARAPCPRGRERVCSGRGTEQQVNRARRAPPTRLKDSSFCHDPETARWGASPALGGRPEAAACPLDTVCPAGVGRASAERRRLWGLPAPRPAAAGPPVAAGPAQELPVPV